MCWNFVALWNILNKSLHDLFKTNNAFMNQWLFNIEQGCGGVEMMHFPPRNRKKPAFRRRWCVTSSDGARNFGPTLSAFRFSSTSDSCLWNHVQTKHAAVSQLQTQPSPTVRLGSIEMQDKQDNRSSEKEIAGLIFIPSFGARVGSTICDYLSGSTEMCVLFGIWEKRTADCWNW